MNYYDFNCIEVYYDGDTAYYCTKCLPSDVSDDMTRPIFQDMELDSFPVCDVCGKEHDYMGLTDFGLINHPDSVHFKMFGQVTTFVHNRIRYFCFNPRVSGLHRHRYNSKIISKQKAWDLFKELLDSENEEFISELFDLLLEKIEDMPDVKSKCTEESEVTY